MGKKGKDEYYLQNGCVGNAMLWWRKNCAGYTTDLNDAHVFTKEEAVRQNRERGEDVPWLKSDIDANSIRVTRRSDAGKRVRYRLPRKQK